MRGEAPRQFEEMVRRGGEEVRLSTENTVFLHDWEKVMSSPLMRKGLNRDSHTARVLAWLFDTASKAVGLLLNQLE